MDNGKETNCKEISVYLDRIEELEDDTAEAVLLIDEGEEDYSGEFAIPINFLPEDVGEGDYLTIKIFREENGRFFIKEIDNDAAEVVLQIDEENYSGEIVIPANFLPEDAGEGDNLTIEIFRDDDKTNDALDEARQLLKELE